MQNASVTLAAARSSHTTTMSEQAAVGKVTAQTVEQGYVPFPHVSNPTDDGCTSCRSALAKLLAFSIALGVVPLSSYFLSQKYLWNGSSPIA